MIVVMLFLFCIRDSEVKYIMKHSRGVMLKRRCSHTELDADWSKFIDAS